MEEEHSQHDQQQQEVGHVLRPAWHKGEHHAAAHLQRANDLTEQDRADPDLLQAWQCLGVALICSFLQRKKVQTCFSFFFCNTFNNSLRSCKPTNGCLSLRPFNEHKRSPIALNINMPPFYHYGGGGQGNITTCIHSVKCPLYMLVRVLHATYHPHRLPLRTFHHKQVHLREFARMRRHCSLAVKLLLLFNEMIGKLRRIYRGCCEQAATYNLLYIRQMRAPLR